jgi:hypothetical protein
MSPDTVRSLAERRVRRQKVFIAVGSVLLLAILGYELPKLLGGHGNRNAAPDVVIVSPGAGVVGAPPPVPVGKLPPTDRIVVVRDSGQLISFGLFKSKDPFVQQLSTTEEPTAVPAPPPPTSTTTTPTSTTPTSTTSQEPGVGVTPVVTTPSSTPGSSGAPVAPGVTPTPGTTTPTAPPPVPTEALISTNGLCERIAVNGTFPTSENIFRLVSIAKDGKSVQLGIVGGSFDSGQPTATLKVGGKLTLVNTADGTRYVIELKPKCAVVNEPATQGTPPPSTTPVSPTPPTTTTTATTTTPIVTDGLDTTTPSP